MVGVDADDNVVLKKEYRYCQGKDTVEIPAGAFEKGEEPVDVAKRELLEETGYCSEEWFYLGGHDGFSCKTHQSYASVSSYQL